MIDLKMIGKDDPSFSSIPGLVRQCRFLSGFDDAEIAVLIRWFDACYCPAGTFILKEGNEENCLCIIVQGEITIYKETEPDKHLKLATINTGESIGEMGVVDGQPFSATAIAAIDSIVLIIGRDNLDRLIDENNKIGIKLLRKIAVTISLRLRRTTGRLADLLANKSG